MSVLFLVFLFLFFPWSFLGLYSHFLGLSFPFLFFVFLILSFPLSFFSFPFLRLSYPFVSLVFLFLSFSSSFLSFRFLGLSFPFLLLVFLILGFTFIYLLTYLLTYLLVSGCLRWRHLTSSSSSCLHRQIWTLLGLDGAKPSLPPHLCCVRRSCLNLRLGHKSPSSGAALTFCSQMVPPPAVDSAPKRPGISATLIHHRRTRLLVLGAEEPVGSTCPRVFTLWLKLPPEHTSPPPPAAFLRGQGSFEGVKQLCMSRDTFFLG